MEEFYFLILDLSMSGHCLIWLMNSYLFMVKKTGFIQINLVNQLNNDKMINKNVIGGRQKRTEMIKTEPFFYNIMIGY